MKKRTAALIGMAAVLLLLAGVFCGAAAADTEWQVDGGIKWRITEGTLTIAPAGEDTHLGYTDGQMKDYSAWGTPWNPSKDSLTTLEITSGVTTIGDNAFYYCNRFTALTIGNSVTTIGDHAFYYCDKFTALTIPNSVTTIGDHAFYQCSGFTGSLAIPNSVTTIGNNAFDSCSGFKSLTIGSSVTTIGNNAFAFCSGFTGSLTIPESVTTIGNNAFECCGFTDSLAIGNSVTTIGDYAFYQCSGFKSLTIGSSVTTIGNCAFELCGFTGSLAIPNSVTTIGDKAFEDCCGFTGSLTIPNHVKTIGNRAFKDCSGFTGSLTIGSSVTTIGNNAFEGCKFTGSLTIPNSVETIGEWAFNGCEFTGLLTIGSSVTTIGAWAFNGCKFTGSLAIPNSVTTIGNNAFDGCSGFTGSLTIGSSVETIGEWAFNNCSGFTGSLAIPNSVTTIGNDAFNNCSNFDIIYIAGNPSLIEGEYPEAVPLAATNEGTINSFPMKPNLATPERTDCTFIDWYKNADFSGDPVTTYEASGKYYAKWSSDTTLVTFKNGGSIYNEQTYTIGQTFSLPTAPTGTGTFLGWRVGSTSGDFFSFYHGTTNIFLPDSSYYDPAGKWTSDTPNLTLCAAWDAAAPTPASHTVTAVAGAGGSISAAPTSPVTVGTPVTLTAAANSGYHFKEWQSISGLPFSTSKDNPLMFYMPNSDVSVTAVFEADTPGPTPASYSVTVQEEGSGTASASKTSAEAGEKITLTASPESGSHFKQWQIINGPDVILDSTTQSTAHFILPKENVTVKAVFEEDTPGPAPSPHSITVQSKGKGSVSASASGAKAGDTVVLAKIAGDGYLFKEWQVEPETFVIEDDNTFTMPDEAVIITAVFEIIDKDIRIEEDGDAPVDEYAVPFSDGEGVSVRVVSATNLNGDKAHYKAQDDKDQPAGVAVYSIFNFYGEVKTDEKSVLTVDVALPPSSADTLKDTICLEIYKGEQWIQIKPTGKPESQGDNVYRYTFEVEHYCPLAIVSDTAPSGSYTLSIPSEVNLEKGTPKSAEVGVTLSNWTEADGKVSVTLDSNDVEVEGEGDKKTKFFLKLNGSPETKAYYQITKESGESLVAAGDTVLGPVSESMSASDQSYFKENLIFSFISEPPVAGTYTGTITFTASVSHE